MTTRWVTSAEATRVLSEQAGRDIDPGYIRVLSSTQPGREPRVRSRPIDGRTREYNLDDLKKIVVAPKKGKRKEIAERPHKSQESA